MFATYFFFIDVYPLRGSESRGIVLPMFGYIANVRSLWAWYWSHRVYIYFLQLSSLLAGPRVRLRRFVLSVGYDNG